MTTTMRAPASNDTLRYSGWGRLNPAAAHRRAPNSLAELQELVRGAAPASLITRGQGRAYGDAAQIDGAAVIELEAFNAIRLDAEAGIVTAGGGATLASILRELVPAGFFLPVSPGTRHVSVGGAIAADVHGKNHHREGSFANHVRRLELVDGNGEQRELSPDADSGAFWATAGGMGLTGVISEASFALIPIETALISVDTHRYADLDALMAAMVSGDDAYRYSVAWVDSLHPGGRGVLTCGDHASLEQLREAAAPVAGCSLVHPLVYDPRALAGAPPFLPGGLLNTWTVRAFNEAWYRKAPKHREGELQAIAPFFHPLDGVSDWNRIYGPAGFLQYQFVVPDAAADLVPRTLAALRRIGAPSFLTVLKRFGPANPAPLSFPQPGWTLAADVSAAVPGLLDTLTELDEQVAAAGGHLYLAKDSRQSAAMFRRSYPRLDEWQEQRQCLDPRGVFASDLSIRLELNKP